GLRHSHNEVTEVKQLEDGRYEGESDYVQFHRHTFTLDEDGRGLTDVVRGHQHVVTRNDSGEFEIGSAVGALRARIPQYGEIQFLDRSGNIDEKGVNVGDEQLPGGYSSAGISRLIGLSGGARKMTHGYVEGGTLGAAIFTFENITPERFPDNIPLDLSIRAYRSYKGDIDTGLRGSITLKHPDKPIETNPYVFIVDEYEVDEHSLSLESEGTDGSQTRMLSVFDDLVDEEGRLQVVVRCVDRGQYLGVTQSGVYLRPGENPFAVNMLKAYASIWLQMTMVIAFGVMFSTFLSGPVAMVATSVCVLLGFFAEQIYDTRHYIDVGINRGGGPVESMVRLLRQDAMTTELDVDTLAAKVIKTADAGIVYSMDAVATALPNLPKMVETAEYAASGFDIFGSLLARHAIATLGY
ncbi:MAG: ABC transporter permease, partial [Planctomycetota bacterium]